MQVLFTLFCVASGLQLIFLLIFLISFLKKNKEANPDRPPVSVVVCAHDEEQNLRELIPILLQQDYPEFEVIIVEDRCNDGTYDFLLEATKQDKRLRMVRVKSLPENMNGKKYGLTLGIKGASHEWIVLTDADCRPVSDQWLNAMAAQFKSEKKIVLGYSPYMKRNGFLNLFIRYDALFTAIQYISLAIAGMPYMGVGRNLAYRKSLFIENKGFNTHLGVTGGDDDLFVNEHSTRTNTAVITGSEAVVHSIPKTTWKAFFFQKVRHLSVGKKYRLKHKLVLSIFMLSLIATWFTGLPLLIFFQGWYYILGMIFVRITLLSVTAHTASRKLGYKFEAWAVPVLDFVWLIYYISTGPVALLTKKVRWTT